MRRSAPKREDQTDRCVLCGMATDYSRDTSIDERCGYIEGAGQLCRDCFRALYLKGKGSDG